MTLQWVWMSGIIFGIVVEVKLMSAKDRLERKKSWECGGGAQRWQPGRGAGSQAWSQGTLIRKRIKNKGCCSFHLRVPWGRILSHLLGSVGPYSFDTFWKRREDWKKGNKQMGMQHCVHILDSSNSQTKYSHLIQKSVLYICVSFADLHVESSVPSF